MGNLPLLCTVTSLLFNRSVAQLGPVPRDVEIVVFGNYSHNFGLSMFVLRNSVW